jgi:hypothetical protein
MYKSRDGGERGSSPAVEDVRRDREEGAEAMHHHATTEEVTTGSLATTGPSNLMDADLKLRASKKIHACASPPPCPGCRHAADAPNTSVLRKVVRARRSATHRCTRAPTSKQSAPRHGSVRCGVALQALSPCKRIERGTGEGEMRTEITVHEMGHRAGRCA